jgi:hypothetical protein
VDDIEEVIKRAEHIRFEEESIGMLNPISALPTSKEMIKKSLLERIELLISAYVSLATFISDEIIEIADKETYMSVLTDMKNLEREIGEKIKSRQRLSDDFVL